jgi:lysophospholipase L1-like esterase
MWWTTPSRLLRLTLLSVAFLIPTAATSAQDTLGKSATDPFRKGSEAGTWVQHHEQHLQQLRAGTTELIFIGDSITDQWSSTGRGVWERYYAPRKAVNLGIGGDRTQHVLWRLEHGATQGISPKVAVVMIGTNNLSSNPPDEVAAGIKAVVGKLRDRLPRTKVLLLGIFPRGPRPDEVRDRIQAINEQIKSLDDGKFVKYLDISAAFLNPDGTISKEIMPDYLHLTARGYRLWADAIEPTLWTLMEGK